MTRTSIGRRPTRWAMLMVLGGALGCTQAPPESTPPDFVVSRYNPQDDPDPACAGDAGVEFPVPADAGVTFPDCSSLSQETILQGTLAGMPFNGMPFEYTYGWGDPEYHNFHVPPSLTMDPLMHDGDFQRGGSLELYWREPTYYTARHSVLIPAQGLLQLQEDLVDRPLNPGSAIMLGCSERVFRFILVVDDGQLVGCAIH